MDQRRPFTENGTVLTLNSVPLQDDHQMLNRRLRSSRISSPVSPPFSRSSLTPPRCHSRARTKTLLAGCPQHLRGIRCSRTGAPSAAWCSTQCSHHLHLARKMRPSRSGTGNWGERVLKRQSKVTSGPCWMSTSVAQEGERYWQAAPAT